LTRQLKLFEFGFLLENSLNSGFKVTPKFLLELLKAANVQRNYHTDIISTSARIITYWIYI